MTQAGSGSSGSGGSAREATGPVGVVVNPVHRAAAAALRVLRREAAGLGPLLVRATTVERPGGPQARELAEAGVRRIVVLGGDGTLREVARALVDVAGGSGSDGAAGHPPVLGILPTGTATIVARNLGVPAGVRRRAEAARRALHGPALPLDVGLCTVDGGAGPVGATGAAPEAFLVMAGLGRDAQTVARATESRKRALGVAAYALPAARTALRPPLAFDVALDGGPALRELTWTVLAGNLPLVPGGIPVFPGSRPDDGALTVLTVPRPGVRGWAGAAVYGLRGALHRPAPAAPPALRYRSARRLDVTCAEPTELHLDGDPLGPVSTVRIEVVPAALRVAGHIVPG